MMLCNNFPGNLRTQCCLSPSKRSRIAGIAEVITIVAFHVDGRAAQVAAFHQRSHAPRYMAELVVVTDGQLEPLFRQPSSPAAALASASIVNGFSTYT